MKTIEDSIAAATAFFEESGLATTPTRISNLAEFLRGVHDGAIDKAIEACAQLDVEAMGIGDDGLCLGEIEDTLQALKVGLHPDPTKADHAKEDAPPTQKPFCVVEYAMKAAAAGRPVSR
jgi:hypothetical protein